MWRRFLALSASVCLVLLSAGAGSALGDEPSPDLDALLSDEALSEESAQALTLLWGPTQPYSPSSYDACPANDPSKPPSFPNLAYKSFRQGGPGSASTAIYLDEYDPPAAMQGPFTVMVMLHGGGFWRGCRNVLQDVAWEGAGRDASLVLSHYYIVLNADYRLACDPNDPQLLGSPILPMCGWNYPRVDTDGSGKIGAATHDAQDAVRWVTSVWQTLPNRPAWNQRVVLLGGSAGGTVAYSTVAPSANVGGAVTVADVAAWSGSLRLDLQSNGLYPCSDSTQTNDVVDCQQSENRYLGCDPFVYPDQTCVNAQRYTDASPNHWYVNTTLPHAFFANGGGPTPSFPPELVSLQSLLDFEGTLRTVLGWTNGDQYVKCIVDAQAHGRGLRGHICDDGSSESVWQRTADFLG